MKGNYSYIYIPNYHVSVPKPVPQGADREVQRPKRGGVQDGVPAGLLVQDVQLSSDRCGLFETGYLYSTWSTRLSSGA